MNSIIHNAPRGITVPRDVARPSAFLPDPLNVAPVSRARDVWARASGVLRGAGKRGSVQGKDWGVYVSDQNPTGPSFWVCPDPEHQRVRSPLK